MSQCNVRASGKIIHDTLVLFLSVLSYHLPTVICIMTLGRQKRAFGPLRTIGEEGLVPVEQAVSTGEVNKPSLHGNEKEAKILEYIFQLVMVSSPSDLVKLPVSLHQVC